MTSEQLSGWIDGELDEVEAAQALDAATRDANSRQTCALYWLIGDCVRGAPVRGADFAAQVMVRLEQEPTVLAPGRFAALRTIGTPRWLPPAAVAAGVVAVLIAWAGVWPGPSVPGGSATIAAEASGAVSEVAMASAPVEEEAGLSGEQAYLMAHQSIGGGGPIAGVAQYIRTVSTEGGR